VIGYSQAADALERVLAREGFDPDADPPRSALTAGAGELLVMPSTATGTPAVKLVTVGPREPRIQGVCVIFDPDTLAPAGVIDGVELTRVRTAAVSLVALRRMARPGARRLVVFGNGPQAQAHAEAVQAEFPIEDTAFLGRDDDRAPVAEADIVCCCTTAREPLFAAGLVREDAAVVAVGSHEPDARELPAELMRRGPVAVESRAAALREAGDVILAGLGETDLVTIAELIAGKTARVFKSVGMAWEDAAVAACAAS
jgi:ornithine cyclodeaminase